MNKDELYDEMTEILEKNKDAEKGFAKAAENADDTALRDYFRRKSESRREFNSKLTSEISKSYADFDVDGSFTGTIHRAWMDVKALFSADDDESMLEESIRGDEAAIEEYDDVLEEENLPVGLRKLLTEQRAEIQNDITNNKSLEDLHD